jgi:DnaJ-domain-containing protein 1
MSDYFALLNEPRRPWLEHEALKQKFLALSANAHPDRVHTANEDEKRAAQERYTGLNAAYNCLREPVERLRHLLELELGERPKEVQEIPPDLADLFLETSRLCREAGAFLAEKQKVTSGLLKVQWFERGEEWRERLVALQNKINSHQEALLAELRGIDSRWDAAELPGQSGRRGALTRLEVIYRLSSYFARWVAQIQELIVQLTF